MKAKSRLILILALILVINIPNVYSVIIFRDDFNDNFINYTMWNLTAWADNTGSPSTWLENGSGLYFSHQAGPAGEAGISNPYLLQLNDLYNMTMKSFRTVAQAPSSVIYLSVCTGTNVNDTEIRPDENANCEAFGASSALGALSADIGIQDCKHSDALYNIQVLRNTTGFYAQVINMDNGTVCGWTRTFVNVTVPAWVGMGSSARGTNLFQTAIEKIEYCSNSNCAIPGPPTINIIYPENGTTYNLNNSDNVYNGWINFTCSSAFDVCNDSRINDTRWVKNNTFSNSSHSFFFNSNFTNLADANYSILLTVNDSSGTVANEVLQFIIDTITPLAISNITNTTATNTDFSFHVNYSDNRLLFSYNLSLNNILFLNRSNLNVAFHRANFTITPTNLTSLGIGTGQVNISTTVCDPHTAETLKEIWDYSWIDKTFNKKIRFDNGLIIESSEKNSWSDIEIIKEKDRVRFKYNAAIYMNGATRTFTVKGNNVVDIIGNQKGYSGWLVVDGKRWVDFNLKNQNAIYKIKRIDKKTVQVEISNLYGFDLEFESAGEVNCRAFDLGHYTFYNTTISLIPLKTVEGNSTEITLTINTKTSNVNSTVNLIYNNTVFATTQTISGNLINHTATIIAPSPTARNETIDFFFNFTMNDDGIERNTSLTNHTVFQFNITNCASGVGVNSIDFVFLDELNSSRIKPDAAVSLEYKGGGTISKDLELSITNTNNFSLCVVPNFVSLSGNYSILYSSTEYPQRRNQDLEALFNNITQTINLYSLQAAEGIIGRFKTVDSLENPIKDVTGTMQKLISGTLTTMEKELSDSSGLMAFFLDPDQDYTFIFNKAGFITQTFELRVTTSEIFTVFMEEPGAVINSSLSRGILISYTPLEDLNNDTLTNFTYNISSSFWDLTNCTHLLRNGSDNSIITQQTPTFTTTFCNTSIELNTDGFTSIISELRYELNNSAISTSVQYNILDRTPGDFSLLTALEDVTNFAEAGFNDVTRMFVSLIAILIITLFVTSQARLTEPEPVIILIIVLVGMFSFIGWLTVPFTQIPNDTVRQYLILVLVTLAGGAYIADRQVTI